MNQEWIQLMQLVPQMAGQPIVWNRVKETALSAYIAMMENTQQQTEYHGEGNVWIHTRMVCEQLIALPDYWQLSKQQQTELFLAALLHDIGKLKTTRLQDGILSAPHHAETGMQIARKLLWIDYDLAGSPEAQLIRETICLLVRYHTSPVNALRRDDPIRFLRRIAANGRLAGDFNLHMLCLLSQADELGRIAGDTDERLDMIDLCRQQAKEADCLYGPYRFPDDHTAYSYVSGRNVQPDVPLYDDTWGEVVMLCGLPGTGKDTWIHGNANCLPMLSLDDIRRSIGIAPTDNQGGVIQETQKRAKEMLAHHQPFVFNATNVTAMMRGKWIRLFEQYKARVRVVFLETGWLQNMRRNTARTYAVPENVISELLEKLTLPEGFEAQNVTWCTL